LFGDLNYNMCLLVCKFIVNYKYRGAKGHTHTLYKALKKFTQMRKHSPSLWASLLSQPLAQISSTRQLQIDAGGLMTTAMSTTWLAVGVRLDWRFWRLREGDRWRHRRPIGLARPHMEWAWRCRLGSGRLLLLTWGEGERYPWHEDTPYPVCAWGVYVIGQKQRNG
jgi:hypothetical protein